MPVGLDCISSQGHYSYIFSKIIPRQNFSHICSKIDQLSIIYSLGCGGRLTGPSGSFTSPSYPSPYHHMAECTWEIHVNRGSRIRLTFLDLDLESSNNCQYDYVRVYDGADRHRSKVLGQYCAQMQDSVVSTGNSMVIVFRTDQSQGGRGFNARYAVDCNRCAIFVIMTFYWDCKQLYVEKCFKILQKLSPYCELFPRLPWDEFIT